MKYLLTSSFAQQNPWYLISSYLRFFVYPTDKFRRLFFGLGQPKKQLFGPGLFEGIEFDAHHADVFNYEAWEIDWPRVESFKNQGLTIGAVHGCYPMGAKILERGERILNLATRSEKIKKALKSHLDLTAALVREKKLLVLHPGVVSKTFPLNEASATVCDNLRSCLDYAQKKEVFVCLENVNPSYTRGQKNLGDDFKFFVDLFERLNHPNLKMVFDWGHANTYAKTFRYHKELINALKEKIVYAHLNYNPAHDSRAKKISHPFVSGWDYHLPLTKIPEEYKRGYQEVIRDLVEKTRLSDFGKITLEIVPEKLFGLKSFTPFGSSDEDALESLKLVKNLSTKIL